MTSRRLSSRSRGLVSVVGAIALLTVTVLPAGAAQPAMRRVAFAGVVADQGEACGFALSWEFTGDVLEQRFFDTDGQLVRIHAHVREFGTITNLDTGAVIDLPRTAFLERVLISQDGVIIEDLGLSVRVTGPDGHLLDVGRFVTGRNPNELLQSSGQHPIREINPFSVSDPALLAAFCGLFE